MVLISIRPFALRKVLLAIVAFLCFSALCFADPVLMVRRYSRAERLAVPRLLNANSHEPVGDGSVDTADPFAVFWSRDVQAREPEITPTDGGAGLRRAVLSSVGRNASCAMRSSGAPVGIDRGRALPDPAGTVSL